MNLPYLREKIGIYGPESEEMVMDLTRILCRGPGRRPVFHR